MRYISAIKDNMGHIVKTDESEPPQGATFQRFPLKDIESTRRSFARLIQAYQRDNITSERFRNLVYSLGIYSTILKMQKDVELEIRITALEDYVHDQTRTRRLG
jgi:hypothetical protein